MTHVTLTARGEPIGKVSVDHVGNCLFESYKGKYYVTGSPAQVISILKEKYDVNQLGATALELYSSYDLRYKVILTRVGFVAVDTYAREIVRFNTNGSSFELIDTTRNKKLVREIIRVIARGKITEHYLEKDFLRGFIK